MWRGDLTVPPRLADLLDRRFDGLDDAGLDALGALVLGEPLPLATLDGGGVDRTASPSSRCARSSHRGRTASTWYRFAHPMIGAAAARTITPTPTPPHRRRPRSPPRRRRRRRPPGDVAARRQRRARRRACCRPPPAAVFLTQPELARRLAERALPHDPTPLERAAAGRRPRRARRGRRRPRRPGAGARRGALGRRPAAGPHQRRQPHRVLRPSSRPSPSSCSPTRRAELPDRYWAEIDSMAAQLTVFSARPADALALAERVLAGRSAAGRARSARPARRVMALAHGRPLRSRRSPSPTELLADVVDGPATPYAQGIAHIAALLARFVYWAEQDAPAHGPVGRWPVPPAAVAVGRRPRARVFHPALRGRPAAARGAAGAAVAPLREAVAQQRSGEGLLRSEAVALLIVALAATGTDRRRRATSWPRSPPDRVAALPRAAAVGRVGRRRGRGPTRRRRPGVRRLPTRRGRRAARSAPSPTSPRPPATAPPPGPPPSCPRGGTRRGADQRGARAVGIAARAVGDGDALLEAAEPHAALGVAGDAVELADLAVAALGTVRATARAQGVSLRRRPAAPAPPAERPGTGPAH